MIRFAYAGICAIVIVGLCNLPERRTGRTALDLLGLGIQRAMFHLSYLLIALLDTVREVVTGAPKHFWQRYKDQARSGVGAPMRESAANQP